MKNKKLSFKTQKKHFKKKLKRIFSRKLKQNKNFMKKRLKTQNFKRIQIFSPLKI